MVRLVSLMRRVIEVFIRNEKVEVPCGYAETVSGHRCAGGFPGTGEQTFRTEKVLNEADRQVLEIAQKVAGAKNLQVKIHDVCTLSGKIRARLMGIKETPTIVVEGQKIREPLTEERYLSLLE